MTACQHCGRTHPPQTTACPYTGDSMDLPGLIGGRVDRYAVEELLGSGGFGAVYRAKHVHTDGLVALKLLKKSLGADQQMLERFLREAKAAAAVGSEHIVRVMDAGVSAEGQAFLAMELLAGTDLKELAQREAPLPHMRLVLLTLQVLEALSAAHERGIVHRDMKPANVFVTRRRDERGTERDFIKLLDFGISKMHQEASGSGLTMTGVAMGTPTYMAPEQFFDARSVDARADLYSVSVMLYELLSGRLPFDAESYAALIVRVKTEQATPLLQLAPQVPASLAQVVTVGLAKDAAHRWQSAKELAQALRTAMGLPAAGSTPAFASAAPATARGTLNLEPTLTPRPHVAPPLPATPSGWVAGPPPTATPAVSGPATGWGSAPPAPSAPSPVVTAPPPAPYIPAPTASSPASPKSGSSSALKWVLIAVAAMLLLFGCCTCGLILNQPQNPPMFDDAPAPSAP